MCGGGGGGGGGGRDERFLRYKIPKQKLLAFSFYSLIRLLGGLVFIILQAINGNE